MMVSTKYEPNCQSIENENTNDGKALRLKRFSVHGITQLKSVTRLTTHFSRHFHRVHTVTPSDPACSISSHHRTVIHIHGAKHQTTWSLKIDKYDTPYTPISSLSERMGKGTKSNKSSSKKQAAAVSKACTCDHPFDCACGNRPPRPSRGHKWDPETQQWGGKGHKQKGASGQIASVSQPKKTLSSGTAISQWEKLPSQLLDQVCQKEGRPRAKYKSIGNGKYRVIVQDAKVSRRGTDHDLFFVPKAPAQSDEIAKEQAALLALLHLTPTIPHERKLPEPYKTTWLQAVEAAKQSKGNEIGGSNTKVSDGQRDNTTTNASRGGNAEQRFVNRAVYSTANIGNGNFLCICCRTTKASRCQTSRTQYTHSTTRGHSSGQSQSPSIHECKVSTTD